MVCVPEDLALVHTFWLHGSLFTLGNASPTVNDKCLLLWWIQIPSEKRWREGASVESCGDRYNNNCVVQMDRWRVRHVSLWTSRTEITWVEVLDWTGLNLDFSPIEHWTLSLAGFPTVKSTSTGSRNDTRVGKDPTINHSEAYLLRATTMHGKCSC